jgi:hypothetical protein
MSDFMAGDSLFGDGKGGSKVGSFRVPKHTHPLDKVRYYIHRTTKVLPVDVSITRVEREIFKK